LVVDLESGGRGLHNPILWRRRRRRRRCG
jgi:hypothetical protein